MNFLLMEPNTGLSTFGIRYSPGVAALLATRVAVLFSLGVALVGHLPALAVLLLPI